MTDSQSADRSAREVLEEEYDRVRKEVLAEGHLQIKAAQARLQAAGNTEEAQQEYREFLHQQAREFCRALAPAENAWYEACAAENPLSSDPGEEVLALASRVNQCNRQARAIPQCQGRAYLSFECCSAHRALSRELDELHAAAMLIQGETEEGGQVMSPNWWISLGICPQESLDGSALQQYHRVGCSEPL